MRKTFLVVKHKLRVRKLYKIIVFQKSKTQNSFTDLFPSCFNIKLLVYIFLGENFVWKSFFLTSFRGLWGRNLFSRFLDCEAVGQENNLQLFILRNGAHGNRVSTNCARFNFEKKKKRKLKLNEQKREKFKVKHWKKKEHKTELYSSKTDEEEKNTSFGEMVRMGTGSVQIVPDLISTKKKGNKR